MRIVAAQHFPRLEAELRVKATLCVARKLVDAAAAAEASAAKAARKAEKADATTKLEAAKAAAAAEKAARKEAALACGEVIVEDDASSDEDEAAAADPEEDETCAHTPENRVEMYREIAEEKAEKDAREKERMPKKRDYTAEQKDAIERTRKV